MSGPTPGPWGVEGRYRNADGTTGKLISHGTNAHGDGPEGYNMRVSGASKEDLALVLAAPDLLEALQNAAATIGAVYQWLDMVKAAGGATSISGIAKCHAMLKSLEGNRDRAELLVMAPARAAIAKATVAA